MAITNQMMGAGLSSGAAGAIVGSSRVQTGQGTTQADATQISVANNFFETVPSGTGGRLPQGSQGDEIFVTNLGANDLLLYPPVGGMISVGAVNASVTLVPQAAVLLKCTGVSGLDYAILSGDVTVDGTGINGVNVGGGAGEIFKDKNGLDLEFKTLVAGSNVQLTNGASTITIAASVTGGNVSSASNVGTGQGNSFKQLSGTDLQFKTVKQGTGITVTDNASDITIAASNPTESLVIACSDETTALTAGTAKVTFRMPYAFTLSAVRASLTTAQASGNIFTVDINESGTTILSTKLTIDNTETTSTTAATPPVISDSSLADDAQMTIDIDQIGNGSAAGLKVVLIGSRT